MLRIYRPIGMLLLLLTETIQEIFSFLALLSFIIIGICFSSQAALSCVANTFEASHSSLSSSSGTLKVTNPHTTHSRASL